jgi:hypothetical protein
MSSAILFYFILKVFSFFFIVPSYFCKIFVGILFRMETVEEEGKFFFEKIPRRFRRNVYPYNKMSIGFCLLSTFEHIPPVMVPSI